MSNPSYKARQPVDADDELVSTLKMIAGGYGVNGDARAEIVGDLLHLFHSRTQAILSDVIKGNEQMTFSNTCPVFRSLEEYMEHVGTIRQVLRDEQWSRASKYGYERKEQL